MKCIWLQFNILFVLALTASQNLEGSTIEYNNDTHAKCPLMDMNADLIVAGIFPIHVEVAMENCLQKTQCEYELKTTNGITKCMKINKSGITWSEAMIDAIRKINNNNNILPGVRLGYIICDSFNNIPRALDISLMLQSLRHDVVTTTTSNATSLNKCSCRSNATRTITGVIGGASSKISISINYIMNVEDIAQISYSSTSPALSDKFNFRTFFRTIPPDTYQGKALIDIMHHFNWSYVSTVATSDDYGRLGVEALKKAAGDRICVAVDGLFDIALSEASTKQQITEIVSELKADVKSTVIILFCEWPSAQAVLQEAEKQNLTGKTWIASEAWGNNNFVYNIRPDIIGGMLGIIPSPGNIEEFMTFIEGLNPRTYDSNPWFGEYYDQTIQCFRRKNEIVPENITLDYSFSKCANVMDAVYALAHALHGVLKCPTDGSSDCYWLKKRYKVNPNDVLSFLRNVSFTEALGVPISFDSNGDPRGSYEITNLQPTEGEKNKMEFKIIGRWDGQTRTLLFHNNTDITWNGWTTDLTRSICSEACKPGYFGIAGKNKCCWKCTECQQDHVKADYGQQTCDKCPNGYMSNNNHTACIMMIEKYLRWSDAAVIALLTTSFTCASLVLLTLFCFVWFRDTPIIKASNRELSYLLLITLFLLFLEPLVFIGLPTEYTCLLRPAGTGLLTTIATAILSVRAYRYLCIFKAKMYQKSRKLQGLASQFLSIFVCTLPPLAAIPILYTFYKPQPVIRVVFEADGHVNNNSDDFYADSQHLPKAYKDCGLPSQHMSMAMATYVILLTMVCCTLAFRTRKLPEVFSDARWLAMTMFANNVIGSASITLYLLRRNDRPMIMAVSIVASGFVLWVFNFLPKLVVILMHPERNKRNVINQQIFSMARRNVNKQITARARTYAIQAQESTVAADDASKWDTRESYTKKISNDESNSTVLTDLNTSNGLHPPSIITISTDV
eukprot:gene11812-13036_t